MFMTDLRGKTAAACHARPCESASGSSEAGVAAVGEKSQRHAKDRVIELDLQRQTAVRVIDGDHDLLRSELLQQCVQILLQLWVGRCAIAARPGSAPR